MNNKLVEAPNVDTLVHELSQRIEGNLKYADMPWDIADQVVSYISDYYDDHDYDGLVEFLDELSGLGYSELKRAWDSLTEKQKKEVVEQLIHNITETGLHELFGQIEAESEIEKPLKVKAKIKQAAKDYLDGRISLGDFAAEISYLFWPKDYEKLDEEERESLEKFTRSFDDLSRYLDEAEVKELVRHYFIDKLSD